MTSPDALPKTILQLANIVPPVPALANSVLILIDQQNEYVEGPLRLSGIDAVMAANARLLATARSAGAAIVHIAQAGSAGGMFDRAAHRGSFIATVLPLENEPVVEKRFASAFAGTRLQDVLDGIGRKSLILSGYMTHNCVASTAFSAVALGYSVAVVSDATASRDLPDGTGSTIAGADVHRAELAGLSDRQALIVTVDQLLAAAETRTVLA